jgi:hypothetical protein
MLFHCINSDPIASCPMTVLNIEVSDLIWGDYRVFEIVIDVHNSDRQIHLRLISPY